MPRARTQWWEGGDSSLWRVTVFRCRRLAPVPDETYFPRPLPVDPSSRRRDDDEDGEPDAKRRKVEDFEPEDAFLARVGATDVKLIVQAHPGSRGAGG